MADRCSMGDSVAHMHTSHRTDLEILDIPSTLSAVLDAYEVDLDAGGN